MGLDKGAERKRLGDAGQGSAAIDEGEHEKVAVRKVVERGQCNRIAEDLESETKTRDVDPARRLPRSG